MKACVLFLILIATITQQQSNYITQPASTTGNSSAGISYNQAIKEFNGYNITAYYAWVLNPINHFRVLYPETSNGSCGGYLFTSRRAKSEGCIYATNGGPFVMHQAEGSATCLGNIVSDNEVVQVQSTSYMNFGLTQSGDFIMGLMQDSDITNLQFSQLLTGFQWLAIQGANQVTTSGGEIAPRTAIGTNSAGNLFLFEADGAEDMPNGNPKGLTLQQTAEWVLELGGYSVVNLDGGGSSVTAINGTVVNFPTCRDVDVKCQRPVTTMTCIMP